MPLTSLELELLLGETGMKNYNKMNSKLRDLRFNLEKCKTIVEEKGDTYKSDRYKNSLEFHTKQLENHDAIWQRKRLEFEEEERQARKTKEENVEKAKRLLEQETTKKSPSILTAEIAIMNQIKRMMSELPIPSTHFPELQGDQPPPSNIAPAVAPPSQPSPLEDPIIKEYIKERGEAPVTREEVELFRERKQMLADMAREKREREEAEQQKKEEAKRQYQLQREMELQQEEQRRAARRQAELDEAELVAKAVEAAKIPIPEKDIVEFEGKKMSKFERDQMLKARKRQEEAEQEEDSDSSSNTESEDEYDEEEIRRAAEAQKAALKKKHEERMRMYYTPPAPEALELPKILSNTKTKKPIKIIKK